MEIFNIFDFYYAILWNIDTDIDTGPMFSKEKGALKGLDPYIAWAKQGAKIHLIIKNK